MTLDHTTTFWERMIVSEATTKYLRLGEYHVWSRMFDGLAIFQVLRTGIEPEPNAGGYASIDSALTTKGLR